jgi:hypothetical protein
VPTVLLNRRGGKRSKRLKSFPIKIPLQGPILNSPDLPGEGSCWKPDTNGGVMGFKRLLQ